MIDPYSCAQYRNVPISWSWLASWKESKLPHPRVVLLGESYWYYFNSSGAFDNAMYRLGGAGFFKQQVHSDGLYLLFADSHAELIRPGGLGWSTSPYPMEDGSNQGFYYHARPSPWYGD